MPVNKKFVIIIELCILLGILSGGCYKPTNYPQVDTSINYLPVPVRQSVAGISVEKRPIMYHVIGQGQEVVFFLAAIHGNEPGGIPLMNRLADFLQQNQQKLLRGRTVVILPAANPDGVAENSRYNANGVDLNRNFDTQNRINNKEFGLTPLSEPEAHIINQLIRQYNPDRIVSFHQVMDTGPEGLAAKMPNGCIDYDGPGQALANHMAKYCDLPVNKLGANPGSLGSYAGLTLGIPTITFEMQKNDSKLNPQILWQHYGNALLAAITYPNPID
jgi:protein MpaA